MPFAAVPRLSPGDRVAVVAPSGPFDRQIFERGLAVLASRYLPVVSARLHDTHRYLAGTDEVRASEVQRAFDVEGIKAIFAARGGYGALRVLPKLRPTGRAVVGFSDVTALHAMLQRAGLRSVHGPVVTQLGTQAPELATRLFDLLEGRVPAPLEGAHTYTPGTAEGPLVGGNMSVLTRLIGTPFMPSLDGAVLLLEDVGERPYRIDRMWTHLRLAGCLDRLAGVAFGDFTGCEETTGEHAGVLLDYSCADVLRSLAAELKVPCAGGFAIGHGKVNEPVVLGARVRLDATAKTLTHLEGLA